jgi:hypothetical protein
MGFVPMDNAARRLVGVEPPVPIVLLIPVGHVEVATLVTGVVPTWPCAARSLVGVERPALIALAAIFVLQW